MMLETPAGRLQGEREGSKIKEYICAQAQQNLDAEHATRKTWRSVLLPEDIGLLVGEMFECMQIHQVHEGDNKSIAETRSQASNNLIRAMKEIPSATRPNKYIWLPANAR